MMLDTIHLWLPKDRVNNIDLLAEIPLYLSGMTEHNKAGNITISGHVGNNFRVNVSGNGISLKGSLCKFYYGNNFQTLTRSETEKAIENLSDQIHLPIGEAKVSRIDFAENLKVNYTPQIYYSYLGDCQYYDRLSQPQSISYHNRIRSKIFYDKIAESQKKCFTTPFALKKENMLRYELRFTGRLPKQFNRPIITASLLHNEKFYTGLIKRWEKEYERINKFNIVNLNLLNMSSPKDFFKQMAALKISELGQANAMQIVEELRARKAFSKPEYYSRLKKEIKSLRVNKGFTDRSDLVIELDQKVQETAKHHE